MPICRSKWSTPILPERQNHTEAPGHAHIRHHRPVGDLRRYLPLRRRAGTLGRVSEELLHPGREELFERQLPGRQAGHAPRILKHRRRSRRLYRRARRRREVECLYQAPLLRPLRMDNTGWFLSEITPGESREAIRGADGLTIPIPLYEITTYPDGGVRTSVSDLSRFFIALLNDGEYEGTRILEKKSAKRCSGSSTRIQTSRTM